MTYDVIIIGGRPAGSTLAARLGQQGLRVLLVERAKFPALPGASSPIIYASTMNMLDEIGADEAAYARDTPKIHRMVNASPLVQGEVTIPMFNGRDYGYAIDRARFDAALWDNAVRFPTVEGRMGWSMVDLLWENDRVVGIIAQAPDKTREQLRARLVIGADGRFSNVARKANAAERDEHTDYPTSIYYAYWKNVDPYDDRGAAAVAYGDGNGYGYLVMDSADGTTLVAFEGQSKLLDPAPGQVETFYLDMLRSNPLLWKRMENAERITDVRGMRDIGNLYRQPGGAGWGLVGDAYHQKDPLDGQGIFDAVFTAKLMAQAIDDYFSGRKLWAEAMIWYDQSARAETYPMYQSTLDRVRTTLYGSAPEWFTRLASQTFGRWLLEDRLVMEQLGMMVTRQIKPSEMMSPAIAVGALLRGPLRDLSRFLDRQIQS